jgi:hypothetical protein
MARRVLKKPEIFPYRSHHFYSARHSDSSAFNKHLSSQPDDNESRYKARNSASRLNAACKAAASAGLASPFM